MAIKKSYELAITIQYDDTRKEEDNSEYRWYDSSGFRMSAVDKLHDSLGSRLQSPTISYHIDSLLVNHIIQDSESFLDDVETLLDQAKTIVEYEKQKLAGE